MDFQRVILSKSILGDERLMMVGSLRQLTRGASGTEPFHVIRSNRYDTHRIAYHHIALSLRLVPHMEAQVI
jgi:hypothetical protein